MLPHYLNAREFKYNKYTVIPNKLPADIHIHQKLPADNYAHLFCIFNILCLYPLLSFQSF